jgi:hypothetical protein
METPGGILGSVAERRKREQNKSRRGLRLALPGKITKRKLGQ